jgi:hypothetical protein
MSLNPNITDNLSITMAGSYGRLDNDTNFPGVSVTRISTDIVAQSVTTVYPKYAQLTYDTNVNSANAKYVDVAKRGKDVTGHIKTSQDQNIYEADFEYGLQPLRWESLTVGNGTIQHIPGIGGVKMTILSAGDVTIRQSRPYHRYQPGKAMYMASAVNFGATTTGQKQRVGFFDDTNGIYFEQDSPNATNPNGMYVCWRTDQNLYNVFASSAGATSGYDTRVDFVNWSDPQNIKNAINWNTIQMIFLEFAWYGAGTVRWGILSGGEQYILHEQIFGNYPGQTLAWARTGNLPVRYEQRNLTANVSSVMIHFGVSVIIEGGRDAQRGFTYAYSNSGNYNVPTFQTRKPVMSIRYRPMGTMEYGAYGSYVGTNGSAATINGVISAGTYGLSGLTFAGSPNWGPNQWQGRAIYFPTISSIPAGNPYGTNARILSSNASTLIIGDVVTLSATPNYIPNGAPYIIGQIDRGQILPQSLLINNNSGGGYIEFISSTPNNPIVLTNPNFVSLSALGSQYSFAERDISATGFTGGEVVYGFYLPSNGATQEKDLSNFFPLYNTVRGNNPDILTIAITTYSQPVSSLGATIIAQEAMS